MVTAFDADRTMVGSEVGGVRVEAMADLEKVAREKTIDIAIVAVPAVHAQEVIDILVKCGVRAILNYAPIAPRVPEDVRVRNIDPVLAMQTMTYHLKKVQAHREAAPILDPLVES